jgi:hypothetical protein
MKAKIIFILWRAWHLHNDVVHGKGMASINGSCKFLTSYAESLGLTGMTEAPGSNDKGKGKLVLDVGVIQSVIREQGEMSAGHQT